MEIPSYIQNTNSNYMPELVQTLQFLLNPDGYPMPPLTTAQIIAVEPASQNGTLWYNSDIGDFQFKRSAGVIRTLVSA